MKPSVFWTRKVIVRAVTAALEDVTNRKFIKICSRKRRRYHENSSNI